MKLCEGAWSLPALRHPILVQVVRRVILVNLLVVACLMPVHAAESQTSYSPCCVRR